jgi:hypothetical protein
MFIGPAIRGRSIPWGQRPEGDCRVSRRTANCPSCGAPVQFLWSSAVQTTCEYCHSILVRHDVELARVGQVADLPPDGSPIQIATEGIYRDKGFLVVGRIVYAWDQGGWNEWHLIYNDGSSGWLSDAQAEYAVSAEVRHDGGLPAENKIVLGQTVAWGGIGFEVTSLTRARYVGVQGELPFEYWDKTEMLFVDLRSRDARFGTIDYSENPPLLFVGEAVDFDSLRMKNLRRFEGW